MFKSQVYQWCFQRRTIYMESWFKTILLFLLSLPFGYGLYQEKKQVKIEWKKKWNAGKKRVKKKKLKIYKIEWERKDSIFGEKGKKKKETEY